MGFHSLESLSDGCNCDQSEVPVITTDYNDYGRRSSSEMEPLHTTFRMVSHPAAALEDSILEKHPSHRLPNVDAQSTTEGAVRQKIGRLNLGDTTGGGASLQVHQAPVPLHAFSLPGFTADTTPNSCGVSLPVRQPPNCGIAPYEQLCSSPAPSLASLQSSAASSIGSTTLTKAIRTRFLVFIKILFKVLDQANEYDIRDRAKHIVAECTRRNRMGDPQFTPLVDAVERRLRRMVGEAHWRKASLLLRHFAAKQNGLSSAGGNSMIPREISSGEA